MRFSFNLYLFSVTSLALSALFTRFFNNQMLKLTNDRSIWETWRIPTHPCYPTNHVNPYPSVFGEFIIPSRTHSFLITGVLTCRRENEFLTCLPFTCCEGWRRRWKEEEEEEEAVNQNAVEEERKEWKGKKERIDPYARGENISRRKSAGN